MQKFIDIIDFEIKGDEKGSLISIEEHINLPFKIKRVYYIYNTQQKVIRGLHAHKKLNQLAICLNGSCDFVLDNGKNRETIKLDRKDKGILIQKNIWREMKNFSEDCVIMVLADQLYDSNDYINDYGEFLDYINNV